MVILRPSTACNTSSDPAALSHYLEQGGNILILPDSQTATSTPWLQIKFGHPITSEKGLPVMVLNKPLAVWDDLRDEAGEVMVNQMRVFKVLPLILPEAVPLLALQDGTPIFAQQSIKKGNLFVSGLEMDSSASTLPLKASFIAFIHNMALAGQFSNGNPTTLIAGTKPAGLEFSTQPALLHAFTGGILEWQGPGQNLPVLPRSGIFSLELNHQKSWIAVRSATDEGREAFINTDKIPALGNLNYRVDDYQDGDSLLSLVRYLRNGIDLYFPLLLLALGAALAEGWIVNFRKGRP